MDVSAGSMVDRKVNYLMEIQEKYEKVEELLLKKDSESKNAAACLLSCLKTDVTKLIDSLQNKDNNSERLSAMLAAIWLSLGVISFEREALFKSSEELKTALNITKCNPLHPRFVIVRINVLNYLGLLYPMLNQPQKSKEYLEEAERLYKEFSELEEPQESYSVEDLFKADISDLTYPRTKAESNLEKSHTLTLYYLAQIYQSLKDDLRTTVYLHNTIKRQLESNDCDPIEWAVNAAIFSKSLMDDCGFTQARHHLAAASYVLKKYFEENIKNILGTSEEEEAKKERYKQGSADVTRYWATYGLHLLEVSRDRLMAQAEENNDDTESPTTDLTKQEDISGLVFSTLETSTYENQVTDKFVLDYKDALPVFHFTKQCLEDAKGYYTLIEHVSDYVKVTRDCSALFEFLAYFESDKQRQCRMHKRRVDMLEHVLLSLNHQCYPELCRQLWYELGQTYFDLLHLKLEKNRDNNQDEAIQDPHVLYKVNSLTQKSIDYLDCFLNSLNSNGSSIMDLKLESELVRPLLMSHFYRGTLFAGQITCDGAKKVENKQKGIASFSFVLNYSASNPSAENQDIVYSCILGLSELLSREF